MNKLYFNKPKINQTCSFDTEHSAEQLHHCGAPDV